MAKTRDELAYCGVDCKERSIYRVMVFEETLSPGTVQPWQEDSKKTPANGLSALKTIKLPMVPIRRRGRILWL